MFSNIDFKRKLPRCKFPYIHSWGFKQYIIAFPTGYKTKICKRCGVQKIY